MMAHRPVETRSTRSVVHARNGMVATSQPLAAAAGLKVLMEGGNAIDAAVATAAVLAVVEPFMTGLGGDMFAMVYHAGKKELVGLNGSGGAPAGAHWRRLRRLGFTAMPERGIHTVTVPGAVDGWFTLLERYGSMPGARLLAPAAGYAREGFPVSEIISAQWRRNRQFLLPYPESVESYLVRGRAPRAGEIFKQPNLAHTLEIIAEGGREAFYRGEIAEKIIAYCNRHGGSFTREDFSEHRAQWVEPLSTTYHGLQVYQLPPNGQGLCVLQMLNILSGFDMASLGHNSADYLHLLIEAKKLSFMDRERYVSDPEFNALPINELISLEYARRLRHKISMDRALETEKTGDACDTVYLCTADRWGNCVSFINSIYRLFGSGMVAGDTGIILQNRGSSFSLEADHFNRLEPRKRPRHTIIPAMVFQEGRPLLCYGVMGGDMQPQGHVQILLNMVHFGMNIQEAGEAPRVCHAEEGVALEPGISREAALGLKKKGHRLVRLTDVFGGFQGIYINPQTGAFQGGSDPRKDGCAIGF